LSAARWARRDNLRHRFAALGDDQPLTRSPDALEPRQAGRLEFRDAHGLHAQIVIWSSEMVNSRTDRGLRAIGYWFVGAEIASQSIAPVGKFDPVLAKRGVAH